MVNPTSSVTYTATATGPGGDSNRYRTRHRERSSHRLRRAPPPPPRTAGCQHQRTVPAKRAGHSFRLRQGRHPARSGFEDFRPTAAWLKEHRKFDSPSKVTVTSAAAKSTTSVSATAVRTPLRNFWYAQGLSGRPSQHGQLSVKNVRNAVNKRKIASRKIVGRPSR